MHVVFPESKPAAPAHRKQSLPQIAWAHVTQVRQNAQAWRAWTASSTAVTGLGSVFAAPRVDKLPHWACSGQGAINV